MPRAVVDITVHVVRDEPTDQAILVRLDNDRPKVWLPRSAIEIEYIRGSTIIAVVTMPVSLAIEKELI
jgi:hypothetical protein